MAVQVLFVLAGAALLAFASDQLVIGASRLAAAARMAPIAIGILVLGFGTSAPELVTSASAAVRGETDVAVGNVLGSSIANLTLVLGVACLYRPLRVSRRALWREAPIAIVAACAFLIALYLGFGRLLGAALLAGAGLFVWRALTVPDDTTTSDAGEVFDDGRHHPLRPEAARTLLGLAGTIGGAQLLLLGALGIADSWGISEAFAGLTLVALGTSLPEVVTVLQAARRDEADLVAGNLFGSNVFNFLVVGGVAALVATAPTEPTPLMVGAGALAIGVSGLAWLLSANGGRLNRWEGGVLLAVYLVAIPLLY
ncbi:calcium/sodium antiporter [Mycobacterium sp. Y57]|uniref:calcium/sodium antiporter n=1 Tax=Mycolicibacterium xanthum TaxID=2796469 RepID=UPI001C85740E|nr:calcium/sodium antiporter [Mycolicibacterium xanthum]MBX7434598.1 calcium/sodium antiporter [Mycolicibacterium xanthum]